MSPRKYVVPNPYPFIRLCQKLKKFGIEWDPNRGKGSHGIFHGLDQSGNKQVFTVPHHQQKEVNSDYMKSLRRRFQLVNKRWNKFFASP